MRTPLASGEPCQAGPLAILALAATVLLVAAGGNPARSSPPTERAPVWRGLVGVRSAQVPVGERLIVVLGAPSLADRVARSGGRASEVDERRWNEEALAKQKALLSRLSLQQGLKIEPDFTYTRVLNGFSAALDPRVRPRWRGSTRFALVTGRLWRAAARPALSARASR